MDTTEALKQVATFNGHGDIRAAAQLLLSSDSDDVEPALLRIMEEDYDTSPAFGVASRILAERDPDRDPEYLLRYFPRGKSTAGVGPSSRVVRLMEMYPPPGKHSYGLSRLRRFEPVRTYADLLATGITPVRASATTALGDTADLAALDPLATALADKKKHVRYFAAHAIIRLGRATSAAEVLDHPIRQALVDALADKNRKVAFTAAFTLASLGDRDAVRNYLTHHPRRRRLFESVFADDLGPFLPSWPGDMV